jgi:hypothetical protein
MDQLASQKEPRNAPTIHPVAIAFVEQLHVPERGALKLCSADSFLRPFDVFGKEAIPYHRTKEGRKVPRDPRLDRLFVRSSSSGGLLLLQTGMT